MRRWKRRARRAGPRLCGGGDRGAQPGAALGGGAKDIKALITDSVEKVGSGSALVNEAGATMNEIVTSVRRVTDIIRDQPAGHEQETGIEQINRRWRRWTR
jgi:hypothetical protein